MGSTHVTPLKHITCYISFEWLQRYGAAGLYESADGFYTTTHYESWVGWHEPMSQAGLGLREEPLYKSSLSVWDLGHEPSPLHLRGLKSQHHENSSSTSTTPGLSVSCTRTLREQHPPPHTLLPSSCPWPLASLSLGVIWLSSLLFPQVFAASFSPCRVSNSLSPMLQIAGFIVCSTRKLFNWPRAISLFSSLPLKTT